MVATWAAFDSRMPARRARHGALFWRRAASSASDERKQRRRCCHRCRRRQEVRRPWTAASASSNMGLGEGEGLGGWGWAAMDVGRWGEGDEGRRQICRRGMLEEKTRL